MSPRSALVGDAASTEGVEGTGGGFFSERQKVLRTF